MTAMTAMNAHEALTKAAEICESRRLHHLGVDDRCADEAGECASDILALRDSFRSAQPDYEATERKHLGNYEKRTGIYATFPEPQQVQQGERAKDAIREANCILNADMPCSRRQELEAELAALRAGAKVPEEVGDELRKAVAKFPTWPTDPFHALAVILEELGELAKATLHKTYEPSIYEEGEIEKEAVQTAAMGARFVRSLSRYRYLKSEQHDQESLAAPSAKGEG